MLFNLGRAVTSGFQVTFRDYRVFAPWKCSMYSTLSSDAFHGIFKAHRSLMISKYKTGAVEFKSLSQSGRRVGRIPYCAARDAKIPVSECLAKIVPTGFLTTIAEAISLTPNWP